MAKATINPFTVEECTHLLSQLVSVDTSQPLGNEAMLVDMIERRYQNKAVDIIRLDHQPGRASLIIKLPGKTDDDALALIGHLDTVPIGDPDAWDSPPLKPIVIDGTLRGRGAADMKGGVAAMLLTLDHLLQKEVSLNQSVLFCFTADEEKNGIGAVALRESNLLKDVSAMIVCEPTNNGIGICEKGAFWVRVSANGVSCHASRPELGANALDALLDCVARIRHALDLSTVHPYLGTNTISLTQLKGGFATNILPAYAELELDIRTLPGVSHQVLEDKINEICRDIEHEMPKIVMKSEIINNRPALQTDEQDPLVRLVEQSANQLGYNLEKRGLFFYTDASQLIPDLGIPFIILGPGDDRQAHTVNEQIQIASIGHYAHLYACLIEKHNA